MGLGVRPSALASIVLAVSMLASAYWYRTTAIGEMGDGERDGMSSMKVGMMGKVYVELVAEVTRGVIDTLS